MNSHSAHRRRWHQVQAGHGSASTCAASVILPKRCSQLNRQRPCAVNWHRPTPATCIHTTIKPCQSRTRSKRCYVVSTEYDTSLQLDQQGDEEQSLLSQLEHDGSHIGPAFRATLGMLEWQRVCKHVASFASTSSGRQVCTRMTVPETQQESEELLRLTRATMTLEYQYATILDFGGINSEEGERGLRRADKAGMCTASQLKAVLSIVEGGDKLRKQFLVASRENNAVGRNSPLAPLQPWISRLKPQASFARAVRAAIDDENNVQDSASETLRMCRQRIKTLQTRLNNLLKGYGGEVSEKGGRMCVALPAGSKLPPASMLLGSSAGGGVVYVEPPAAVAANNDLAAARGEAYSAEETVLYNLTGQLMGILSEVQETFKAVIMLDVLAAKVRYGLWMNGVLPTFVPWNTVFHERGSAAARRRQMQMPSTSSDDDDAGTDAGSYSDGSEAEMAATSRYAVRLRGLRHPLLYGDYLQERQRLERELRRFGIDPSQLLAESASANMVSVRKAVRPNGLSSRREGLLREYGLDRIPGKTGKKKDAANEAVNKLLEAYKALTPPVPLDLAIKPHTSVVVITGPNTGGKTATMKALGLVTLMARAGLPIPCESPALLPAYSSVLADIGDEQSLTANLSTFSGHLMRIQALRAEADGRSLVLLDELGTGTDPVEGAALGVAILRRMVEGGLGGGALTIATTHHSIMTGLKFDDSQGRFENASVEFDHVALAPTYKLLWGIPGKSNALNIAARLGLDLDVIEAARARLDESVATSDAAITQLEQLRAALQDQETATWAIQQEGAALEASINVLREEVTTLQSQLADAKEQALYEVWLAAKKRLEQLRMKKRVKGPTAVPKKPSQQQDMAELAAQITGSAQAKPVGISDQSTTPRTPSAGKSDGVTSNTRSNGVTLDDLVDVKVDFEDLIDDLSSKQKAAEEQTRAQEQQFIEAVSQFEANIQAPGSASSQVSKEDDEYAGLALQAEQALEVLGSSSINSSNEEARASTSEPSMKAVKQQGTIQASSEAGVNQGLLDEFELLVQKFESQLAANKQAPAAQPAPVPKKSPPAPVDDLEMLIAQLEDAPVPEPVTKLKPGQRGKRRNSRGKHASR